MTQSMCPFHYHSSLLELQQQWFLFTPPPPGSQTIIIPISGPWIPPIKAGRVMALNRMSSYF